MSESGKTTQREIAIRISNLRKQYQLGLIGCGTLRGALQSWWARFRGHEDPNLKIGASAQRIGKNFWALDGIDLTICKGERIGIIGSNGAGKSTLLKILSRVTAPTEGDVDIYGRISSMLEIGTGFHREFTGRENIYMNGAILGMPREVIDAKLEDIIDFSEIREFIDTPVKRYSSGMFVKLAFAVAANLDSEIVVMDEVLAVGDMAFQQKCLDKMREISEQQERTILYVSHNMATIRRLCNRCIVLSQGKVIYDGEVEKGIAIYLDNGTSRDQTEFDLQGRTRTAYAGSFPPVFRHLNLLGENAPKYEAGDKLAMKISLDLPTARQDLCLALRIHTNDGIVLGTAISQRIPFVRSGLQELLFSIPLGSLARGTFYASLGICQMTSSRRPFFLEYGQRLFQFEVTDHNDWNTTTAGYWNFPDATIKLLG